MEKQFTLSTKYFGYYVTRTFLWIRVFKITIAVKNTFIHPKLFSERNGYVKHLMIGKWLIKIRKQSTL